MVMNVLPLIPQADFAHVTPSTPEQLDQVRRDQRIDHRPVQALPPVPGGCRGAHRPGCAVCGEPAVQGHEMRIEPLLPGHVPDFLNLAGKEGWISEEWEFDFVLNNFPEGCWIVPIGGIPAGYITAARYEKSGWVGNLLVREEWRGRGLGGTLLRQALSSLDRTGAEITWLTASPAGQPLYEKLGFVAIDRIIRWRGRGGGGGQSRKSTGLFTGRNGRNRPPGLGIAALRSSGHGRAGNCCQCGRWFLYGADDSWWCTTGSLGMPKHGDCGGLAA